MPPAPVRTPSKRTLSALPESNRLTFLLAASQLLAETLPEASSHLGSQALKWADLKQLTIAKGSAARHCRRCGSYCIPKKVTVIKLSDTKQWKQKQKQGANPVSQPAQKAAAQYVCQVCGNTSVNEFVDVEAALKFYPKATLSAGKAASRQDVSAQATTQNIVSAKPSADLPQSQPQAATKMTIPLKHNQLPAANISANATLSIPNQPKNGQEQISNLQQAGGTVNGQDHGMQIHVCMQQSSSSGAERAYDLSQVNTPANDSMQPMLQPGSSAVENVVAADYAAQAMLQPGTTANEANHQAVDSVQEMLQPSSTADEVNSQAVDNVPVVLQHSDTTSIASLNQSQAASRSFPRLSNPAKATFAAPFPGNVDSAGSASPIRSSLELKSSDVPLSMTTSNQEQAMGAADDVARQALNHSMHDLQPTDELTRGNAATALTPIVLNHSEERTDYPHTSIHANTREIATSQSSLPGRQDQGLCDRQPAGQEASTQQPRLSTESARSDTLSPDQPVNTRHKRFTWHRFGRSWKRRRRI